MEVHMFPYAAKVNQKYKGLLPSGINLSSVSMYFLLSLCSSHTYVELVDKEPGSSVSLLIN